MKEQGLSYAQLSPEEKAIYDRKLPDNYYNYKLKGTIIHYGTAEAGHYYSYIQERTGKQEWYEFNDHRVQPYNKDNLSRDAFGGEAPLEE